MIKLVIGDDNEIVLTNLIPIAGNRNSIEVVGKVIKVNDILKISKSVDSDGVIIDIDLQDNKID